MTANWLLMGAVIVAVGAFMARRLSLRAERLRYRQSFEGLPPPSAVLQLEGKVTKEVAERLAKDWAERIDRLQKGE